MKICPGCGKQGTISFVYTKDRYVEFCNSKNCKCIKEYSNDPWEEEM